MDVIERMREFFGRSETVSPVDAKPDDMKAHIRAAYKLLYDANRRAIQVPADVVKVITEARGAADEQLPSDLEARFWNAYGLLSSSIQPAERARTYYRRVFYVTLAVLLLAQFFYTSGDYVRSKMAELDKQIIDVRGRAVPTTPNAAAPPQQADVTAERVKQIQDARGAYHELSHTLLNLAGSIVELPLRLLRYKSFFRVEPEQANDTIVVQAKLEMLLVFLSGYLLPMLYGLLGACAFVLRKLSDEIEKLTYAHDARVRYSLRLNVGLLSGLAVGWFIKPGAGDATLVSLSPLALAFIAGYGSDLFFVALDKIVQAFAGPTSSTGTTTVREITSGGLTRTESRSSEVHVAGREAEPRSEPSPPREVPPQQPKAA